MEGRSEIDIQFEGRSYLVFVEAKLGSDISLSTTYDPERNQIVRNIDCVLEVCGKRHPVFWMFVRDRQPTRAYIQLMEQYRDASKLCCALPHRAATQIKEVTEGLAVVTWADLMNLLSGKNWMSPEAEVQREIQRRVA